MKHKTNLLEEALDTNLLETDSPLCKSLTDTESIGWLRVIDEAMVIHDIGVANVDDSYEVAKVKLNQLLCCAQSIGEYFSTKDKVLLEEALEQLKINRTNFRKGPSKSISKMLASGNDEIIEKLQNRLDNGN